MTFSTYFSPGVALQGGGGGGGGGAASAPLTGTGATITTSTPLIDTSQTWNAGGVTFTGWNLNVTDTASAAGSLLMDLQVGGASRFKVSKEGNLTGGEYLYFNQAAQQWVRATPTWIEIRSFGGTGLTVANGAVGISSSDGVAPDLILTRRAAANLRLGAADAAAPVAQTLSIQSVVAGTSNTAGTNFTIAGSQGTGTGAGGSLIFQVAPAGSSGSAVNALATALTIDSTRLATFAGNIQSNSYVYLGGTSQYIRQTGTFVELGSFGGTGFSVTNSGYIGFSTSSGSNPDVILNRDAANTLALRNGTAAQTFNVYNTFTDASNYERARIAWVSNVLTIGTEKLGTGTARALEFQTDGTTRLTISTTGAATFTGSVTTSGVAIGANISIPAAGVIAWSGRCETLSPADKVLRIRDNAGTGPAILQSGQFTVANLPAAATYTGSMAFVSDATATTPRSTVAGGGANKVMVMSDGANWLIVA